MQNVMSRKPEENKIQNKLGKGAKNKKIKRQAQTLLRGRDYSLLGALCTEYLIRN